MGEHPGLHILCLHGHTDLVSDTARQDQCSRSVSTPQRHVLTADACYLNTLASYTYKRVGAYRVRMIYNRRLTTMADESG